MKQKEDIFYKLLIPIWFKQINMNVCIKLNNLS